MADHTDDFWPHTFALSPAAPVRFVSAAGGLVIAAGDSFHMLRPGSQRLRSRPLPPELGEIVAVAAEPWSPYRFAVASLTSTAVYTGHQPYVPIPDIRFEDGDFAPTHLAWSRSDGESLLYIRRTKGDVQSVNVDDLTNSMVGCPAVSAVAGDARGNAAIIDVNPVEPAYDGTAWVLRVGGANWVPRSFDCGALDDGTSWAIYLAVHGAAVAYSMIPNDHVDYCGDTEVSWAEEGEDHRPSFELPPGVFEGPIAFQNERVIIAAYNADGQVNVLRWARNGSFTRIARFGCDDAFEGTPATVTGIAWDEERRALWAASPELGLIKLTEPRKPAGAKVAAN